MRLPIDDIRERFDAALVRSNRLVVTAETGAGKSTRIPVWLSAKAADAVLVVEPRRVACHALADFLASERGERTGQFFGSSVRFSNRSGPETRVLFCTPGVALRMLADHEAQFGAIVVDEFHERSWQMDLVVAAAASLDRLADVPLVLTSATIDAEAAAAVLDAETLHATGRTFPVQIRYADDVVEPTDSDLAARVAAAVEEALARHEGDVLVFLPGIKEIRSAESALGRRPEEIVVVHGSRSPEAMQRAFRPSPRRRIYLSTNVAETSITLPGVRVVIDSGLAKTRLHRAGRSALATVPISQASMDQRAGRAGRVAAGACIRLWSERYRPAPHATPEIARIEVDDLLLQAAHLGLSGSTFREARWVTAPPDFAVSRARRRLESLGALDAGALTQRGAQLSTLPVSAEEAAVLIGAPDEISGTVCDVVAILQLRGSLLLPTGELAASRQLAVKQARAELLRGITDEVSMNLALLRRGDPTDHHLSGRRLNEVRAVSRQLRGLLGANGDATTGLADFLLRRWPSAGFVLRPRAQKPGRRARSQPWANGSIEVDVYPFEPLDPETDAAKPTAAVILETEWLGSGTGVRGIGRMLLPTSPRVLADAGLGEVTLTDVRLEKSRGVRITAAKETQLAGVTLDSRESDLSGVDLQRAVAGFVLENRLFKGVKGPLLDALHGWRLLAAWPDVDELGGGPVEPPEPDDPVEWLTQWLGTLGLEEASELALLRNEDLVPDLPDVTGIAEWAARPVLEDFPRVWSHQGATYRCEVNPETRKVVLEPHDAAARKAGEPKAALLPRFRGFSVIYKQASRTLRLR